MAECYSNNPFLGEAIKKPSAKLREGKNRVGSVPGKTAAAPRSLPSRPVHPPPLHGAGAKL